MNQSRDLKILEAILFASTEPVLENDLKEKIVNKDNIFSMLKDIQNSYSEKGVNLIKTGNSWSFTTSPELSKELIIFKKQKRKLSRAALETLSIIAYHQPITRPEIEEIRGVQMGRGSIDNLMEIGWIKPKGRRNAPGRPTTWSTTDIFLEHFGLENIDALPNKEELKASGFLEKKSAISTITDLANDLEISQLSKEESQEEEKLEDFISENQ
jgi:segregation and condensation protein B